MDEFVTITEKEFLGPKDTFAYDYKRFTFQTFVKPAKKVSETRSKFSVAIEVFEHSGLFYNKMTNQPFKSAKDAAEYIWIRLTWPAYADLLFEAVELDSVLRSR